MGELIAKRFPWEPVPVSETVAALQRDVAYMVAHTAVVVRSTRPELQTTINTPRGQVIPRGVCKFTDGTTFELVDIGMPQIGAMPMTIEELMTQMWDAARALELELEP